MLMRIRRFALGIAMIVLAVAAAHGQDYPNKPVRIVTTGVGSGSDLTSRLIAQEISGPLSQPVIVDNRPGGITSMEVVSKAPPDGYTLLMSGGSMWIMPLLRELPYDPVRDFSPITLTEQTIQVLVVHPSLPAKSVKELIALAKASPGEINYASSGAGTGGHLAAELFKYMAGVNLAHVPYKGGVQGATAVLGGEVQLTFGNPFTVMPHVKTGRLRALAITSAQPSALVPGLPTVAASGLLGYEATASNGVFAPARTPGAIVNRLNHEIVRVLTRPDVKGKYFNDGVEIVGSSPEGLAAAMKSDTARLGKMIKAVGIKAE